MEYINVIRKLNKKFVQKTQKNIAVVRLQRV